MKTEDSKEIGGEIHSILSDRISHREALIELWKENIHYIIGNRMEL